MRTILIIADDPPSHQRLVNDLTQDGHIVLVAATPDEVAACLQIIVVECIIAQPHHAPLRRDDIAAALRASPPAATRAMIGRPGEWAPSRQQADDRPWTTAP